MDARLQLSDLPLGVWHCRARAVHRWFNSFGSEAISPVALCTAVERYNSLRSITAVRPQHCKLTVVDPVSTGHAGLLDGARPRAGAAAGTRTSPVHRSPA